MCNTADNQPSQLKSAFSMVVVPRIWISLDFACIAIWLSRALDLGYCVVFFPLLRGSTHILLSVVAWIGNHKDKRPDKLLSFDQDCSSHYTGSNSVNR